PQPATSVSAASNTIKKCFNEISGIYLSKYNNVYGLQFYSPAGGLIELDSNQKATGNYFSDLGGFYECKDQGKSRTKLSHHAIYYNEAGNQSVITTNSDVNCLGAHSDCSDNVVYCSNGTIVSQTYPYELPDPSTGKFTNPILPVIKHKFESQRLYKHPIVNLTSPENKCYNDLAGIYITRYSDGSYAVTVMVPSGYFVTVLTSERNADGTFNRGTGVGGWYCTNTLAVNGISNYFNYPANRVTNRESIGSSAFYMQCPAKADGSTQYENCTGELTSSYYPLQYQRMPFRGGSSSPSLTFTSNRYFTSPSIRPCHGNLSGVYAVRFKITTPPKFVTQYIFNFYQTGILQGGSANENNEKNPTSNIFGTWECNNNSNLELKFLLFGFVSHNRSSSAVYPAQFTLKCQNQQCTGTGATFSYLVKLPHNGKIPGTPLIQVNYTITAQKLQYENY
ncbi:unnamed protein product, partial [Didymodactylos carnosus]